jgi:hypothetical protein
MATKTKKIQPRARNAAPKVTTSATPAAKADKSKKDAVLRLLRRQNGASIAEIAAETDWLPHSVRGFLTATVRKKLELPLVSTKETGSDRRYHIAALKPAKE